MSQGTAMEHEQYFEFAVVIFLFILTPFCKAIMAEISNLNNFSVHVTILVYLLQLDFMNMKVIKIK